MVRGNAERCGGVGVLLPIVDEDHRVEGDAELIRDLAVDGGVGLDGVELGSYEDTLEIVGERRSPEAAIQVKPSVK